MTTIATPAKKLTKDQALIMGWLDHNIDLGLGDLYVEIGRYKTVKSMATINSLVKRGLIVVTDGGDGFVRVAKYVEPAVEGLTEAQQQIMTHVTEQARRGVHVVELRCGHGEPYLNKDLFRLERLNLLKIVRTESKRQFVKLRYLPKPPVPHKAQPKAVETQPEPAPAAAPEVAETVATPAPDFAEHWTVDEVAECLPGMTSFGAYDALWSFVPADDQEAPTLADVWDKLEESHRVAIIEGYANEYPQAGGALAVKRTYRHMIETGCIFKCCPTTRAYTHVVVASENRDHDKAEVLTANWEKFWREHYRDIQQQISHPYDKHGRPLAPLAYNSAVSILNNFPTEQAYVDYKRQTALARLDASEYKPAVMEWLTSLEDAQKTAQAFAQKPCFTDIKVEAINGGTR